MKVHSFELKLRAKMVIFNASNKAILASAVIFALLYALSVLASNLSGYSEWFIEYYKMMFDYASGSGVIKPVPWPEVSAFSMLLCIIIAIMQSVLNAGYTSWCMTAVRGQGPVVKDIFNGFAYFSKVLCLLILCSLITTVGLFIFVIPGVFFLYRYKLAIYVLFDNPEFGVVRCMRESAKLTRGHLIEMLLIDLSFIGWWFAGQIVACFTAPIADVWIRPYYGLSIAFYYEYLSTGRFPEPSEAPHNDPL